MNMFSYYITTQFITSNKDYNFYRNFHSVNQTYPKYLWIPINLISKISNSWIRDLEFNLHLHQKPTCVLIW